MADDRNDEVFTVDIDSEKAILVHGDIDMASGPILEAAIFELEDDQPIVIDLAGVCFIDSSGLRSLLGASRRASTRGTVIILRTVGPEVRRLLRITGTTEQFTIKSWRD